MKTGGSIAVLMVMALVLPQASAERRQRTVSKEIITANGKFRLQYLDLVVGMGDEVKKGDTIVVHYTGWIRGGKKIDSSHDRQEPFMIQIGVGNVILGWDEGVPGMKVGGKRKLTIPSELAYGDKGAGNVIPPNAELIFEVELLRIVQQGK
jgi:FKBP-type peptidyl-prolyl cis-trans isomerase